MAAVLQCVYAGHMRVMARDDLIDIEQTVPMQFDQVQNCPNVWRIEGLAGFFVIYYP